MPVLQMQTTGMACGTEGLTHGSTGPSDRSLQTNLEHALLHERLEWELVKGSVQDAQIQDWP